MLPLIKIVTVTIRLSLRPITNWMKLLSRHRWRFLSPLMIRFGNWTHRFEIKLNRMIINPKQGIDFYIKPLNDDAAFQKGAETFIELLFYYLLLMGIYIYDIRKAHKGAGAQQEQFEQMQRKVAEQDVTLDELKEMSNLNRIAIL